MSSFKRFEEIEAWKLGRELNVRIYRLTATGPFSKDFALRDQIRRAAISVSSNVAEGYARRSPADFARFVPIARASATEVCSQLYLALDLGYIEREEFDDIYTLCARASAACGGLSRYLRSAKGTYVSEPEALWPADPEPLNPELQNP